MAFKIKKVISISRRCDLIAHYPDFIIDQLHKYPPGETHTLVIWTKNPANLLNHINLNRVLRQYSNLYLLLTITGMGCTIVEPGVPCPEEVFKQIPDIIDFTGGPEHIGIRYDPLIEIINTAHDTRHSNISEAKFEPVLNMISCNKIPRLIVSVAQKYVKAKKRMQKAGLVFAENYHVKAEKFITGFIGPKTSEKGVVLSCCTTPNLTRIGCIDNRILSKLHPDYAPAGSAKDRSQREYCNCTNSRDIGKWYGCGHGCVYCYGNPAYSPPKG